MEIAENDESPRFRVYRFFWLLLAAFLLVAGCGRGGGTHVVRGTVTYQGQPLQHGSVMFNSIDTALPPAVGRIDSDGTYELRAAPGEYKVVVNATTPVDLSLETDDPAYKPPQSLIPENYSNPMTSPLQATVGAGDNVVDLTL